MSQVSAFRDAFQSVGKQCVAQLEPDLFRLVATGDALTRQIHVDIELKNPSWESRMRAIDAMLDVREQNINEVALDFLIAEPGEIPVERVAASTVDRDPGLDYVYPVYA